MRKNKDVFTRNSRITIHRSWGTIKQHCNFYELDVSEVLEKLNNGVQAYDIFTYKMHANKFHVENEMETYPCRDDLLRFRRENGWYC